MNDEQDHGSRHPAGFPDDRFPADPAAPHGGPAVPGGEGYPGAGHPDPGAGHPDARAGHPEPGVGSGAAAPAYPPVPRTSWGGESDADATAFVRLPDDGWAHRPAGEPPAAPGHGYQPPEVGTAAGPRPSDGGTEPGGPTGPVPPVAAAAGPADTGLAGGPGFLPGGSHPYGTDASVPTADEPAPGHAAPAVGYGSDTLPGHGQEAGAAPGHGPTATGHPGGWPAPEPAPGPAFTPGLAAAMGQGAAAALAGFHQGQGRSRRPDPGAEEPAAPTDGEPATPAAPFDPGSAGPVPPEDTGVPATAPDQTPAGEAAPPAPEVVTPAEGTSASDHPTVSYTLRVNGLERAVAGAWIGESLLYVLRERLGLAGAKDGCSQGECGACSVQVDGRLVMACLVPAATAAGSEIRTVEGLGADGAPSDVQRALARTDVECGFCLPGMAMTVHDLLEGNHRPTTLEARCALSGNLCRCSGYRGVLEAVRQVADERHRAASPAQAADQPRADQGDHPGGEPEPTGPDQQGTVGHAPPGPAGQDQRDEHQQHRRDAGQAGTTSPAGIPRQAGPAGRGGDT